MSRRSDFVPTPVLFIGVLVVFAALIANGNYQRRLRFQHEEGSLQNAVRFQQTLDNIANRNDRYPRSAELDTLMRDMRPVFGGMLNTHTGLLTEPRTSSTTVEGAIVYAVADDGCSDTLTVVGEFRQPIWRVVGTVGEPAVILGVFGDSVYVEGTTDAALPAHS